MALYKDSFKKTLWGIMLLSHPNYPLKSHLINTKNRALEKYKSPKLNHFDEQIIKDVLKILAISHDFGKSSTYFQKYIRGEKVKSSLKKHSAISFLLTNYIIEEYLKNNNIKNKYYQLFSLCVKNHHSFISEPIHDLGSIRENKEILKKQFDSLDIDFINNILKENNLPTIEGSFSDILEKFYILEDLYDELKYTEENELKYEFYFLYVYLFSRVWSQITNCVIINI